MDDARIVVSGLCKQYRGVTAVDDLSFTVEPGRVTGFLGPNGAGKTTTLRMLLGLVAPSAGTATIGGRRYADLHEPVRVVGAVLEASSAHKGRTGRNHLRACCITAGLLQPFDQFVALHAHGRDVAQMPPQFLNRLRGEWDLGHNAVTQAATIFTAGQLIGVLLACPRPDRRRRPFAGRAAASRRTSRC